MGISINSPIKFDARASYSIVVQGNLPEELYPIFPDMKIAPAKGEIGIDSTLLTGNIRDQAALAGILNMLYDLHCPILLVEYLPEKAS